MDTNKTYSAKEFTMTVLNALALGVVVRTINYSSNSSG